MDTSSISLTPERLAQLEAYAQRRGKDAATALDDVLADYLAAEQQEHEATVAAVMEAYEDVKAGRTQTIEEFLEELRAEHGFPS